MGKRSDFERRKNDAYQSPPSVVMPLLPFIQDITSFAEPCLGEGQLADALESHGKECTFSGDIETGFDATVDPMRGSFEAIITNPPWTRALLHPMILRFQQIAPTWLLFDADWPHTAQSAPYLDQCSHIVSIGRVKWIADSKHVGKDNAAWYRFHHDHSGGPRFFGKEGKARPMHQPALWRPRSPLTAYLRALGIK